MEIAITRTIAAPAARVFGIVADIPNWPKVIGAIQSIDILSGAPVGVGTHFRETRTLFGRSASEDMYVAALDSPHRLLLTADSHGMHYITEYTVEPIDAMSTRLTLRFRGTPETITARILSRLTGFMVPKLKKAIETDMNDLAAAAVKTAAAEKAGTD